MEVAFFCRSDESPQEVQHGFGDLAPAVVDCERVAPVGELDELGEARVPAVGEDRPRVAARGTYGGT